MDAQLKAKWVETLRSGEFAQTRGKLFRGEGYDYLPAGYCCLGVLAKIQGCELVSENHKIFLNDKEVPNPQGEVLPESLRGRMSAADMIFLASKNDAGKSFDWLADYIEKNL